jgi:hypothetical protein
MAGKIFINYRRDDKSRGDAKPFLPGLSRLFPPEQLDVDNVDPGLDFTISSAPALQQSGTMLIRRIPIPDSPEIQVFPVLAAQRTDMKG